MLKTKYNLDEKLVIELLKTEKTQKVRKTVFRHYKKSYFHFLKKIANCSINESCSLYDEAFSAFIEQVRNGGRRERQYKSIFDCLVLEGGKLLGCKLDKINNNGFVNKAYLPSEVIIILIKSGHINCFKLVYENYKEPLIALLEKKYGSHCRAKPIEVFGESLMILKENIKCGKVGIPMRSRLFTYFVLIAKHKFLQLENKLKGIFFSQNLVEQDFFFETQVRNNSYVDYLNQIWPSLSVYLHGNDIFKTLISSLKQEEQEILRMRFYENMRYREIGQRLSLKEGTCRKRVHACLKKWRRQFFRNHVLPVIDKPTKLYLKFHLEKGWSVAQIARHFNIPAQEVNCQIYQGLSQWRKRFQQEKNADYVDNRERIVRFSY